MANYDDLVEAAAKKWNVDPALVKGVIRTESGGNPKATSPVGAQGLMQLMPGIAKTYGVKDAYDPAQNIDAGTRLLAENLDRFGNVQDALRAYHGGLDKKNWGEKTQAYPGKVMASLNQPQQPKNLPGIPESASSDADAIFSQRFGAVMGGGVPAKSGDAAEQIFAQRFGGALASTPTASKPAAAPMQITAEWARKNPVQFQNMLEAGQISPEQWQAITGSTGSAGAGIRDVVSGIVQRGAHTLGYLADKVAPGSDLAKTLNAGNPVLDKQVAQQEQAYQAARAANGSTGMDIGRAVTGAVPMLAVTGGPVNGLGGLLAQGAQLGAVQGLMTPVTSGNYGEESAKNVGVNAALGAAIPAGAKALYAGGKYVGDVGRSLVAPFTEKGQQEIASKVVNQFAKNGQLASAGQTLVPGSLPKLTEATGNAGLGALERGLASANPEFANQLAERAAANNAARVNALQTIAGSPEARQVAIEARDVATQPLYEVATGKAAPIDKELNALLARPSVQSALSRAENLAKERGQKFSLSEDSPLRRIVENSTVVPEKGTAPSGLVRGSNSSTQTVPGAQASIAGEGRARGAIPERFATTRRNVEIPGNISLAGEGAPRVMPYEPARSISSSRTINPYAGVAGEGTAGITPKVVSGNDLQTLKMSLDSLLEDPTAGIAKTEANAIKATRNKLVNWMENKIPEFKDARTQYAELSKPLAQMDIAQRLLEKYSSATTDLAGNPKLRAEAFNRALQDEQALLKRSGAFAGYKDLSDVFSKEQLSTIKNIAKDLSRSSVGQNAGRPVGSNTFQNLATSNMLQSALPGRVGQFLSGAGPGTIGGALGGGLGFAAGGLPGAAVGGMVGSRAGHLTNQLMATQNEAIQARIANMLLGNQMPVSPAAAAARGLNPALLRYLSPAGIGLSRQSVEQPQ